MKDPLNYTLGDQLIPEASSCKYLGIILRSDLNWSEHVKHTVKKTWKAPHFIMRILKKGNSSTKRLTYTTIVGPILEYGLRVGIRTGTNRRVRKGANKSG